MVNLPKLEELDFRNRKVFVRGDLDVPLSTDNSTVQDDSRLQAMKPTLKFILDKGAKQIIIGGHLGRSGEGEPIVSSKIVLQDLESIVETPVGFKSNLEGDTSNFNEKVVLLENLRTVPFEEQNDSKFAEVLMNMADLYVNESFATSHRNHASIVSLPKKFKERNSKSIASGLRLAKEVEVLSGILENPRRPLVFIISGIKKDKLDYIQTFSKTADKVLVGGRLPDYLQDNKELATSTKLIIADLIADRQDITIRSIEKFEAEIANAGTIVLAGVVGKYEDEAHRLGTTRVFTAIANSNAYKLMGGGDSEAAATMLGLTNKFDWISVGGGAMLEFLSKGTLPGIEALLH